MLLYTLNFSYCEECNKLYIPKNQSSNETIKDTKIFKEKIYTLFNRTEYYNHKEFYNIIKDIYNENTFKFELTDNNHISEWKQNYNRVTKYSIFEDPSDGSGKLLLRKYTYEFI